jgi:hypothetical protein
MGSVVQKMPKFLRALLSLKLLLVLIILSLFLAGYAVVHGSRGDSLLLSDLRLWGKLLLFRHSAIKDLNAREVSALFNSTCNRGCHSMDVIYGAIHTPLGWGQVVERMGNDNGVKLYPAEREVIIRYLQENYPPPNTTLPPATVKTVKRLLWRNDMGYGDVYVDIFYATKEYFRVIESLAEAEKYVVDKNLVFIIDLTVHTGKLPIVPLDEKTFLRDDKGHEYAAIQGWSMRMESKEGHHREGVVRFSRFDKQGNPVIREDTQYIEVVIKDLAGAKERVYRWDLPVPYPEDIKEG